MFYQCLYFNITALARVLDRALTDAFGPFGLTPSQAFLLRAVLDQPGMLQRELVREMAISRPTATRSLDGLKEKGLVERRDSGRERLDTETMTQLMKLGAKAQKFLELKSKLTLVGAGRAKTGKTKVEA